MYHPLLGLQETNQISVMDALELVIQHVMANACHLAKAAVTSHVKKIVSEDVKVVIPLVLALVTELAVVDVIIQVVGINVYGRG